MHTVLPALCTGCDLCVAPCPMDCIAMVAVAPPRSWTIADASAARARYHARNARLAQEKIENDQRLAAKAMAGLDQHEACDEPTQQQIDRRKAVIQAAIERARARRQRSPGPAKTNAEP
jgi:electron transport complex protein RnfB